FVCAIFRLPKRRGNRLLAKYCHIRYMGLIGAAGTTTSHRQSCRETKATTSTAAASPAREENPAEVGESVGHAQDRCLTAGCLCDDLQSLQVHTHGICASVVGMGGDGGEDRLTSMRIEAGV